MLFVLQVIAAAMETRDEAMETMSISDDDHADDVIEGVMGLGTSESTIGSSDVSANSEMVCWKKIHI